MWRVEYRRPTWMYARLDKGGIVYFDFPRLAAALAFADVVGGRVRDPANTFDVYIGQVAS